MPKNWQVNPPVPAEFIKKHPNLHPVLLQIIFDRGLTTAEEIADFFNDEIFPEDYTAKYDPFLFKDMAAAVDLVIKHIKAGDKIMVYGDYDADGVTATVILYETLQILKANVGFYLPDRVSEGYGLSAKALEEIVRDNFKLIITVDCGTRNPEEVAAARAKGIDVIVTDHHVLAEDPKDVPDCLLINGANPADKYPFKFLAGVGISFKLIEALISKTKLAEDQKKFLLDRNLDLVAIGTVADLVKLLGENRLLVKRGLAVLNNTKRLGLQELFRVAKIGANGQDLDSWNIAFQLSPRLNAASRIDHANTALELLITKDRTEASKIAADLNQKNIERQKITEEILAKVEAKLDIKTDLQSGLRIVPEILIGLCDFDESSWNEGVIGLVAGKLAEKYYRPALVITRTSDGFKGSGRSIEEFNLIAAIENGNEFLDKYGGHPMACGFSVYSEEKLNKFIDYLKKNAAAKLAGLELMPKLKIDAELKFGEIDLALCGQIEKLAPYGQNNPQPRFVSYQVMVGEIVNMGSDNQHIKLRLTDPNDKAKNFWAVAFGKSEEYGHFQVGDMIDAVYYLEINKFNGRREAQMKIIDIRK